MPVPYTPIEENALYVQKKEPLERPLEISYASRVAKRRRLRSSLFIALFIAFSCLLPYIGDLDCVQHKKTFGLFYTFEGAVWYLCMALLILIGWGFAFVNSRKKESYHFILLVPIVMTLLQVLICLAYLHYFLPFVNRVIANLVVLGVLSIVTVFWLRNKPLKKRCFWPYVLITAASVLPYIHWLPYFRNLKGIGSIELLRLIIDIVAIFLNGTFAWGFAYKASTGKQYRFAMLAPIVMLSVQLTVGFLLKLTSKKLFSFQTIDIGVFFNLSLLLLLILNYFRLKHLQLKRKRTVIAFLPKRYNDKIAAFDAYFLKKMDRFNI